MSAGPRRPREQSDLAIQRPSPWPLLSQQGKPQINNGDTGGPPRFLSEFFSDKTVRRAWCIIFLLQPCSHLLHEHEELLSDRKLACCAPVLAKWLRSVTSLIRGGIGGVSWQGRPRINKGDTEGPPRSRTLAEFAASKAGCFPSNVPNDAGSTNAPEPGYKAVGASNSASSLCSKSSNRRSMREINALAGELDLESH